LHVIASCLLFGVLRRTLARLDRGMRPGVAVNLWAAATAALWALHPLQTESVICVAQRTELLGGGFILLTLYAFVRAVSGATWSRGWASVAIGAAWLGVIAKETVVTAPLLVWLYDRAFVAGGLRAAWRQRRGFYLALVAAWLPLLALLVAGGGTRGVAAGLGLGVSSWDYLLTQAGAIVRYLALTVWPHPLVLDYGTAVVRSWQQAIVPGLIVLGLLGWAGWLLVRRPRIGLVVAWAFVLLAPSSSVIPLVTQTIAEHRMYLPLAGPVVAIAFGLAHWRPRWAIPLVLMFAGVLGLVTVYRALQYRDPVVIWSDTVAHAPDNPRAEHNLGLALQQAGDGAAAEGHYARAVALDPRYVPARYAWGLARLQRDDLGGAVTQFEAVVAQEPRHADAWLALGNARMRLGQPESAVNAYETSLRLVDAPDVRHNLVLALVAAGRSAELAADLSTAEHLYRRAVERGANEVEPRQRLALLLARGGRMAEAEQWFRDVLRLAPGDLDALANLANVLVVQGRALEAIPLYQTVLQRRPGDRRTEENLAAARASLR
jgi:tetratricopeptide (TPR) repeat protein